MRGKRGFTLIELMIVIAIIAIIAAIAIPGLLRSQRASHETGSAATLRSTVPAEVDFKTNDRDGNGVSDFWTRDVSGLACVCPVSGPEPLRLIEIPVALADSNPLGTAAGPVIGNEIQNRYYGTPSPKAGYWFLALPLDEFGVNYAQDTGGAGGAFGGAAFFNHSRFAFMAYPETPVLGRYIYYVSENNTLLRRSITSNVRPPGTTPPGTALIQAGAVGSSPLTQWPTDTQMKADYSKLD